VRFADNNRFSYILDEVAQLISERPSRIQKLVSVIDEWKSEGDKPGLPKAAFRLGQKRPWQDVKDLDWPYDDIPWSEPSANAEPSSHD